MYEATFRIEGRGSYAAATAGVDASLAAWCSDHCDLLSVRGADAGTLLDRVRETVGVRERAERAGEVLCVTETCPRDREDGYVDAYLARHDCLLVPPLRYAAGAKRCRALALTPGALTDCYRDLVADGAAVTVVSKREVGTASGDDPPASPGAVLSDLSRRQRETLRLAVAEGYYEIPRGTTTAALGERLGVSRRTAEEHLRRAENKLVHAVAGRL